MGSLQQIFQQYVDDIRTLLILAQSAGRVEKYQLEVVFSPLKSTALQKNPHDEGLLKALMNAVQTVEKMIAELSYPEQEVVLHSSELQSSKRESSHATEKQYNDENSSSSSAMLVQPPLVEICPESHERLEYSISHLSPVDHHFQTPTGDCLSPTGDCLSPQHPTTKETEAANVLMNLSGKAADRVGHSRLEPPCLHSKAVPGLDGKTKVFLLPAGSSSAKVDSDARREAVACDEVPQINEKDLLPLATQVLCQFCSRQCEDLVELHEHVLAMHNVPDGELPLMPSVRRHRNPCEEEAEEVSSFIHLPSSEMQKENLSRNCVNPVKSAQPLRFVVDVQGLVDKQDASSKKRSVEEKAVTKRGKSKSTSYPVSHEVAQEPPPPPPPCGLVHHALGRSQSRDVVSHQAIKTIRVTLPPLREGPPPHGSEPEAFFSEKQQQFQTVVVGSGQETQILGKQRVARQDVSSAQVISAKEPVPAVSDALAIAVESSQIRIIEAKVTIYVCLKCSWSYTHSQEYKNHLCSADRPFIKTCSDGSVVFADNPGVCDAQLQISNCNVWYFPEFLIRQMLGNPRDGVQNLEIVHCTSGRKLQLYTSYQPSYLSEQFISFRCPICEKDSDSLNRFLEHLTVGPCMFRCPECSLVYKTQDKLQNHRVAMHPNIEDRTCPNCHMVFEKRHQRNKHLKTKCSRNHICSVCGRVLKNEYNLNVHMQSHKEREHVCKECGASFYRRTVLLRHMMRHTGTRPHACTICSARFFTRQHLNTHLDRHNGFKSHPCSACSKAYYSKHDRDNHFLKVHNKTPSCQSVSKLKEDKFGSVSEIKEEEFGSVSEVKEEKFGSAAAGK